MGQAQSHLARPTGFWRRIRSKAVTREPSQESFVQLSPPTPEADHSSAQTDQSFTTADTTPAPAAPYIDMHGDAMAVDVGKVSEADNSPQDQHMTDTLDQPDKPDQPTQAAEESTPERPALKREYTPPHRIRISTNEARKLENAFSTVHDHITKTLNRVSRLPLPALVGLPSA